MPMPANLEGKVGEFLNSGTRLGWIDVAARPTGEAQILVVDDEELVRESLARLLTSEGFSVRTAASAEEADHWVSSARFDAMLLDVELPRMNGVEFLGWALERDPELAVIMLTGVNNPDLARKCIEKGARTYLVKPIHPDFLRLALRDALAMRSILMERNRLVESD